MSTQKRHSNVKLNVLALVLFVAFAPFALADIEIHPDGSPVILDNESHPVIAWIRDLLRAVWSAVKNH